MPRERIDRPLFIMEHRGHEINGTPSACWIWTRTTPIEGRGYARKWAFEDGRWRKVFVHRHYWEKFNGKVPDGLVLDHLCRQRICMRPGHLEAVTPAVNIDRGETVKIKNNELHQVAALRSYGFTIEDICKFYGVSRSNAYQAAVRLARIK